MSDYFVHESSYIDKGALISKGCKIWHFCHIQSNAKLGEKCIIGQNVNIANDVQIGNGVKIQNNVSIYKGVRLENWVFCGPSCVFTNDIIPRAKYPKGEEDYLETLVKEGASLGANSTIVCGHTIGRWAFVAAGSVVINDIPDYAIVVGNPARQIGWICECGQRLSNNLQCIYCQRKYNETEAGLIEIGI